VDIVTASFSSSVRYPNGSVIILYSVNFLGDVRLYHVATLVVTDHNPLDLLYYEVS
jgi:hypothetical protein